MSQLKSEGLMILVTREQRVQRSFKREVGMDQLRKACWRSDASASEAGERVGSND